MGSWSVHCGISRIAITAGQECYLLPLQKGSSEARKWIPLCLPLKGIYDDYGGIEEIERSLYNSFLEQKCDLDLSKGLRDFPFEYMWIDAKVYDFVSSYRHNGYNGLGSFDMGEKELLLSLGFEYRGKDDTIRYNHVYEKDSVKINSDGTWLKGGFYNIQDLKKKVLSYIS